MPPLQSHLLGTVEQCAHGRSSQEHAIVGDPFDAIVLRAAANFQVQEKDESDDSDHIHHRVDQSW